MTALSWQFHPLNSIQSPYHAATATCPTYERIMVAADKNLPNTHCKLQFATHPASDENTFLKLLQNNDLLKLNTLAL